ncbi:ankyrin-1-like [Microplitis demolitor]|uniref:ankyrin-1-like n=1 Tax=Microplitis demolitor TaxID=69319 RepID=UPI00235B67A3|nr:ankyrin-1-like [Microplitis demolitor]
MAQNHDQRQSHRRILVTSLNYITIEMTTRKINNNLPSQMTATEEPPSKKTKYSKLRNIIPEEEMDVDTEPELTLPVAIKNEDIRAIDYLLNKKIDVNINQESSPPALDLAVETQNSEVINKKVNLRDQGHPTHLNVAIKSVYFERLRLLMNSVEDIKEIVSIFHPLYYAAQYNAVEEAEYLIAQGADVETFNNNSSSPFYQCTPLSVAINCGSFEMAQLLINNQASVHTQTKWDKKPIDLAIEKGDDIHSNCLHRLSDFYQYTPLHVAIQQGSFEVAQFLLSKGADVNICGKNGETPLKIAIEKKNSELFQLLFDAEAKIHNCPNEDSPLHQAVAENNHYVTKFLLERGFDVNVICKCPVSKYSGYTPLQLAVSTENLEIINLLFKYKADVNKNTKKLGSVIGIAVDQSNYELYELLLKAGADIRKSTNMTLLHRAVGVNNYRIADDLIERGADVNVIKRFETSKYRGCSPLRLQISIMNENKEIASLLLEKQAKVHDKKFVETPLGIACECDETLLYHAVSSGHIKIVELLLENGAKVNAINDSGETALIAAVLGNNLELMKILINAGAQVNLRNNKHHLPLHRAVQRRNYSITRYLIEQGADINSVRFNRTPLTHTCSIGSKDIAELLIKNGAVIDDGRVCMTALGIACQQADFELVELLVNFGASVDFLSGDATPLYWAVKSKNLNFVKYFIDYGVKDINAGHWGNTPLFSAIGNQDLNIVELLLEHRATMDNNGPVALGLAIKTRNLKLVELILHAEGSDINAPGLGTQTPLEILVQDQNVELMKLLLNYRANIDFITRQSRKFIFHVLHVGTIEMQKIILSENIDINCRDINDKTLLLAAIRKRSFRITKLILMREDFVNINDVAQGESALHEAAKQAYPLILNLLLNAGADVNLVNKADQTAINTTNIERIKKIIREHMVKLKAAGWSIINQNRKAIKHTKGLYDFYIECLKEVELMKNLKIDKTIMNYYDVMHMKQHEMAVKLNNFNDETLNEQELQLQFPLYGQIIYYRLVKSLQRKKLLNTSTNVFGTLLSGQLPFDIIRAINPYLNNRDLKALSLC